MTWADFVVRGTLVLAVGFGASYAFGRASAAVRHLIWTAAFLALLALPVALGLGPKITLAAWPAAPVVMEVKTLPQNVRENRLAGESACPTAGKSLACESGTGFSLSTPACGRVFSQLLRERCLALLIPTPGGSSGPPRGPSA
jgi:hypothetical protein